ncbi:class I tRNA ligase family protein [Candidatus Vidania fulgoroideorum]
MINNYNHKLIEKNILKKNFFKTNFYCISMIPYPSGKLHLGHIKNYTINDIICRYLKTNMYMAWDSFGLPAENYSISKNIKTKNCIKNNIKNMKNIMNIMGFNIDWNKEICTSSKKFYKYTQYFFIKFYKKGYIYKKKSLLYWDSFDKTVLSKEQIINGRGWRSGKKVKKKLINSYFVKLNKKLIESILKDIKISKWPKNIKNKQINWIGKLNGYKIKYKELNLFFIKKIKFNSLIISLNNNNLIRYFEKKNYISKFFKENIYEFDIKERKIYFIGYKNIKNRKIPIFIDNKLKYNNYYHISNINPFLKIKFVNKIKKKTTLFNINKNYKKTTIYKILDWNISRQRYWGTPIPMVNCKNCGLVPRKKIPVKVDYKKDVTKCPKCKKNSYREKDTLDTFFDSSWYFLYLLNKNKFKKKVKYTNYNKVNIYIGGEEHSILHLLYSRIFLKILYNIKIIKHSEPFKKLIIQGLILNKSFYIKKNKKKKWISEKKKYKYKKVYEGKNTKMSKSKKNGIEPKIYIKKYGVDALRMYIVFATPISKNFVWDGKKIIGCYRFIKRIWNFAFKFLYLKKKKFKCKINKENIDFFYKKYYFNILISKLMIFFKNIKKYCLKYKNNYIEKTFSIFLKKLYPICPYVTSYIWMMLNFSKKYKNIYE